MKSEIIKALITLVTTGSLAGMGLLFDGNNGKVGICHYTGSEKNPYQYIRVSRSAVAEHEDHHKDIIGVKSKKACPKGDSSDDDETPAPPTAKATRTPKATRTKESDTTPSPTKVDPTLTPEFTDTPLVNTTETPNPTATKITSTPIVIKPSKTPERPPRPTKTSTHSPLPTPTLTQPIVSSTPTLDLSQTPTITPSPNSGSEDIKELLAKIDELIADRDAAQRLLEEALREKNPDEAYINELKTRIDKYQDRIIDVEGKLIAVLFDQILQNYWIVLITAVSSVASFWRSEIKSKVYETLGKSRISRPILIQPISVHGGEYARLELKVPQGMSCTPVIFYKSSENLLSTQQADRSEKLFWRWKVPNNVKPGIWKIHVKYFPGNQYEEFHFEIKPQHHK